MRKSHTVSSGYITSGNPVITKPRNTTAMPNHWNHFNFAFKNIIELMPVKMITAPVKYDHFLNLDKQKYQHTVSTFVRIQVWTIKVLNAFYRWKNLCLFDKPLNIWNIVADVSVSDTYIRQVPHISQKLAGIIRKDSLIPNGFFSRTGTSSGWFITSTE